MRKEVVIAILLGFSIGLLIVFGIITARSALQKQSQTSPITTTSTATSQPGNADDSQKLTHQLTIHDPVDNQVVSSDRVTIRGLTSAKSTVVIVAEEAEFITIADEMGNFSQEISLVSGANEIDISAFSPAEEKVDTLLTIVYTTYDF